MLAVSAVGLAVRWETVWLVGEVSVGRESTEEGWSEETS